MLAHYHGTTGAAVVQEAEQALPCRDEVYKGSPLMRFTGQVQLPQAPGVERQIAYCEDDLQLRIRDCYLFAGRGEFAMQVDFNVVASSFDDAADLLSQRLPTLVPALETVLTRA
ncbi:hypothetical protein GCM10017788_34630 [Amycolatopsis acidiphila]|nr:hypothetical protein GCM10017788_34630 [Amycolatopsis acidiphila]